MVRMLAPEGVTQVSVEQQNFTVAKDGFVTVPDPFVKKLKDIGFKVGPFVVTVTQETAAAIKNTAAQVGKAAPKPAAAAQTASLPDIDYAKAALFLQARGYKAETPEAAQDFVAKMSPSDQANFVADFKANGDKPEASGAPAQHEPPVNLTAQRAVPGKNTD